MSSSMVKKLKNNNRKFHKFTSNAGLNVNEVLHEVFIKCSKEDRSKDDRFLFLFNSVVNHISKIESYFESKSEIIICLSSHLFSHIVQVRASALRVLRFLINTEEDVQLFNSLQLPFLICRSLDIVVDNEEERIQALKLIRKIVTVASHLLSSSIVKCLVSLADTSMIDGKPDRIVRSTLAVLSEIAVLTPELFILNNGVSVITRNVIITDSPRMNESLVAVLLYLFENPKIRKLAGVNLECIAASYCDFTYRLIGLMDKNKDIRELRFKCSRLSLLSVLKSWPGVIEFCNPRKKTCLRAIIDVMYLNQLEVRKAVLDLFYELFAINQPTWSDEVSVALGSIDPSNYQSSWGLTDGFVAAEGKSILPSLRNNVPNICDTHQALLIYCLIENGIIEALIDVIVNSDTFISIRSTILLAKILQIVNTTIPENLCYESIALPNLIYEAAKGNPQALKAISTLQSYQQLLRNRPAPISLYLDFVIQNGHICKTQLFNREICGTFFYSTLELTRKGDSVKRRTSFDYTFKSRDNESINSDSIFPSSDMKMKSSILKFFEKFKESEKLIKDSMIFSHVDCQKWDFDILLILFRNNLLNTKIDETQIKLVKLLITYFKPSSNKFSHIEITQGKFFLSNVMVGIELIDFLIRSLNELEYLRILTDFCSDISSHLHSVCKKKVHDSLFSPNHMENTMCQQYFIFIGRISKTNEGLTILKNTDILKNLLSLVTNSNHPIYAKLIISGLDYSSKITRSILEKALVSSHNVQIRLYATQFLLVLFRVKLKFIEEWGIKLLLNQLKDKEKSIQLIALDIIEEICHENDYLLEVLHDWPKLHETHESGKFIMMHFYSVPRGINHPEANVEQELKLWNQTYNKKYVLFVECENHNAMTLNKRNEDGVYNNRISNQIQHPSEPSLHLPMHLFGALVRTQKGFELLQKYVDLIAIIQMIQTEDGLSEDDCFVMKSALWAIGWISTHNNGVSYLKEFSPEIFSKVIYLAKNAEYYSLRWTAFHVISLMSTSIGGADILLKYNWVSVRHKKNVEFPVCEPEVNLRFPFEVINYDDTMLDFTLPSLNTSSYSDFQFKLKEVPESKDENYQKVNLKTRSLSESKTQDDFMHRVRFNSGDSNTSGISSFESTQMKLAMSEKYRRASISAGCSSPQPRLHETSLQGIRRIQNIKMKMKLLFNESTSDGLDDINENDDFHIERKLKTAESFKKKVKRYRDDSSILSELMEGQEDFYVSRFLPQDDKEGRCYRGICLPKNINDLFGENDYKISRFDACSSPVREQMILDFQDMKFSIDQTDDQSSIMQVEAPNSIDDNIFQHNSTECLRCCRYNLIMKILKDDESQNELCSLSSEYDKIIHKHMILRNVDKLASPIHFKSSKIHLIEMKQKYPKDFVDICLYSEVCKRISSCSYRFHVRRFIQELFYGLELEFINFSSKIIITKRLGSIDFTSEINRKNLESICENVSDDKNQTTAEIHDTRPTKEEQIRQRSRIHTLELDLSCTKNRFPIKRQLSTTSSTSPNNENNNKKESLLSPLSYSYSFTRTLYCEQRLLPSKSEATLDNKKTSTTENSTIKEQSNEASKI